ncbi:hypothetical protein ACJMK2_033110 [Sinanodonta woodiana]|uniref:Glyoxylate reductase/hydroxypyruvate reductase n=1 Tax=Sinanodonta woodiana TaxID=1069815 RepID=A0ABD3X5C8_SINWO
MEVFPQYTLYCYTVKYHASLLDPEVNMEVTLMERIHPTQIRKYRISCVGIYQRMDMCISMYTCRSIDSVIHGGLGRWDNALYLSGIEIKESVIGIAGFGRIGFATAKRLKAFEPSKIIYWDVGPLEYAKEIGAEFASFEELLKNSDIIIVCVSLTDGTRGLFNKEAFKKMKPSVIFINTSRGAVVNQDDLYTALTTGQILAAGLDVTTPEPLPRDNPLLSLPNCTISPHIASVSNKTRYAMAELTARNIIAGLKGEKMPAPVC